MTQTISLSASAHLARRKPSATHTALVLGEVQIGPVYAETLIEISYDMERDGQVYPLDYQVLLNGKPIDLALSPAELVELIRQDLRDEAGQAAQDRAAERAADDRAAERWEACHAW